jgi:hypothetical protein
MTEEHKPEHHSDIMGLEIQLDENRSVSGFMLNSGDFRFNFVNGAIETTFNISPEAVEAMHMILIETMHNEIDALNGEEDD